MPAPQTLYQPYAASFADGTCKHCPTALQVVKDAGILGQWSDKVIIVTGCSAGIGIETARALYATGATVYLAVRNLEKGSKVMHEISSTGSGEDGGSNNNSSNKNDRLELLELDTSNLTSVRAAAREFLSKEKSLNILINNAGVMACPFGTTVDGFETHMATNHFGHFLFFQLLKQTLLDSSTSTFQSRVINTSSSGHRISGIRFDDINFQKGDYSPFTGYGQSKLANVYMANSIERHYGSRGIHAFSVHPGIIVDTGLSKHCTEEQIAGLGSDPGYWDRNVKTVEQGAATQVWAAVSPELEGKGGTYLSNVGEAPPAGPEEPVGEAGHSPDAYNEDAEERLWKLSYAMVGLSQEQ